MTLRTFFQNERGATAIELGLVLPLFLMMLIGLISAAQLGWAVNSLNFAVAEAARCSAVNAISCGTNSATITLAQARYVGPEVGAQFNVVNAACGRRVSATGTFLLQLGLTQLDVPVGAQACYPAISTG